MKCYHGTVLTVNAHNDVASYLVEDGGKIVFVGNELPEKYAGVPVTELGKKALIPSFADTHQHFASFSTFFAGLNVMDAESNGLNPAQTQNGFPAGSASGGFGLVQWTPRTKYSDWAGADWQTNFDKQLQRIMYELNNGLQWQWRPGYTQYISFYDFTRSNDSLDYLTGAFLYYYEGPGDPAATIGYRRSRAAYWYQYITGIAPGPAGNLPIWLLFKLRWNNTKR